MEFSFTYQILPNLPALPVDDQQLLTAAREICHKAYATYSGFQVGAAALLANGQIITGTNQENASYPVGICAERALLAAAGSFYPDMPIRSMAISYHNSRKSATSDHPISPCGMCRQALQEFEDRTHTPIRLILSGQEGEIYIIDKASWLLPLAFSGSELRNK